MEAIWDWEWRIVPAVALILTGEYLAARGVGRLWFHHRLGYAVPGKALALVEGLRLVLGGGALVAIGAGWLWHVPLLLVAGLVIGFEETLETSIVAHALAEEKRRDEA